jgi:hypothetical protein
MTKGCTKCGVDKPLDEFHKCSRMKDGHTSRCKMCTKADSSKRWEKIKSDPDMMARARGQTVKWRLENKEKSLELARKWKKDNDEYIQHYRKFRAKKFADWSDEAKKRHVEKMKEWAKNNHKKRKEYSRQWARLHPETYKRAAKSRIENLHPCYIKALITQNTCLKNGDIPDALVEVKREHVKLIRKLKEYKNGTHSKTAQAN